ncbi:MAG: hypothetical protein Q4C47_07900 [Planctomycetia bacterium]|nr:hypothetical protein [Planctomycetia bacterium]
MGIPSTDPAPDEGNGEIPPPGCVSGVTDGSGGIVVDPGEYPEEYNEYGEYGGYGGYKGKFHGTPEESSVREPGVGSGSGVGFSGDGDEGVGVGLSGICASTVPVRNVETIQRTRKVRRTRLPGRIPSKRRHPEIDVRRHGDRSMEGDRSGRRRESREI